MCFYSITVGWFVTSVVTGKLMWRLTSNLVLSFITAVFTISLLKIKRLLDKAVDIKDVAVPNKCLFVINLVTFSLLTILYIMLFALSFRNAFFPDKDGTSS